MNASRSLIGLAVLATAGGCLSDESNNGRPYVRPAPIYSTDTSAPREPTRAPVTHSGGVHEHATESEADTVIPNIDGSNPNAHPSTATTEPTAGAYLPHYDPGTEFQPPAGPYPQVAVDGSVTEAVPYGYDDTSGRYDRDPFFHPYFTDTSAYRRRGSWIGSRFYYGHGWGHGYAYGHRPYAYGPYRYRSGSRYDGDDSHRPRGRDRSDDGDNGPARDGERLYGDRSPRENPPRVVIIGEPDRRSDDDSHRPVRDARQALDQQREQEARAPGARDQQARDQASEQRRAERRAVAAAAAGDRSEPNRSRTTNADERRAREARAAEQQARADEPRQRPQPAERQQQAERQPQAGRQRSETPARTADRPREEPTRVAERPRQAEQPRETPTRTAERPREADRPREQPTRTAERQRDEPARTADRPREADRPSRDAGQAIERNRADNNARSGGRTGGGRNDSTPSDSGGRGRNR